MSTPPDLYPTVHYRTDHSFPHTKISTRVSRARVPYACASRTIPPPTAHADRIGVGQSYVSLTLHPQRGVPKFRVLRLCAGCAIAYGLASQYPIEGVTAPADAHVGRPTKRRRFIYRGTRSR